MPQYLYRVKDDKGRTHTAVSEATDPKTLRRTLRERGWYVFEVTVYKSAAQRGRGGRKITSDDLIMFTHQISSMLDVGIPILNAMDIIWKQVENPAFQVVVSQLRNKISQGESLHKAFSAFPDVFPPMYLSLLQVAEVGANLVKILRKLLEYLTHEREFIGKLKRAITYPMIVVLFAFMVVLLMLFWVIPTFEQVFTKIKVELPLFTQIIIKVSQVIRSFYFWVVSVGGGYCGYLLYKKYASTKSGRRAIDRIRLKIPVFGKIVYSAAIARFVQALSLLLGGGLPIARGLEAAKGSILNSKLTDAVDWASKRIREGAPLGVSLAETQVFPTFLVEMINVGEESGSLVDMLDKVSAHFEEDFDFRLNKFLTILEPVLIILVGGMVIFILLTIYLPIFKLWGGIGGVAAD